MPEGSEKLGTAVLELKTDSKGLEQGLQSAEQKAQGFGGTLGKLGKMMGGLAIGGAIVGGVKKVANVSADFETQVNILKTAVGGVPELVGGLSDAALQMGADTDLVGISASQSVEAMTNFAKAGLSLSDMFGGADGLNAYMEEGAALSGALRAAVDLQAASELDLASASDAIVVAMSTFGIGAEDAVTITNSLVQAADASVTSVPAMVEAIGTVGPVAARMGFSLDDLNTALALLSQKGIEGATAGTQLKSMLMAISGPSGKAAGLMEDLGIAFYDTEGTLKSLPDILANVERGMAGLSQEASDEALKQMFGTYGGVAASAMSSEGMAQMAIDIGGAATASETAAARTQGLNASLEAMQGTIETFMIKAGTPLIDKFFTPLVKFATDVIESVIPMLDDLGPGIDRVGEIATGIFDKIGGMGTEASDAASGVGGGGGFDLNTFMTNMFAGIDGWLETEGPTLGPKVGGAIKGAFDKGIVWLVEQGPTVAAELFETIKTIITGAMDIGPDVLTTVGTTIGTALGTIIRKGIELLIVAGTVIATELWKAIKGIFDGSVTVTSEDVADLAGKLLGVMVSLLNGLITGLSGDPQWATKLKDFFVGDPDGIITKSKQAIVDEVENMKAAGKELVNGLIQGIKDAPGAVVDAAKGLASDAVGGVKNFLGIHSASTVFEEVGGFVVEGLGLGIENGMPMVQGPLDGVMGVFDRIVGWLTEFAIAVGQKGLETAGETFEDIADGIEDMATAFMEFAQGAAAIKAGNVDKASMVEYLDQWTWATSEAVKRVKAVVDDVGWKTIGDMKGRATRLATILQSVTADLSRMKPGKLGDILAYLDQMDVVLPEVVRRLVRMVTDPETGLGSIILDDVVTWSGQLSSTFVMMTANLEGVKPGAATFLTDAETYLDQVFAFAKAVAARIKDLPADALTAYEAAAKAVPWIAGMLGLMGKKMEAELPEEGFEERLPEYLRLGEWALGLILPAVNRMLAKWGQAAEGAKSALEVGAGAVGWISSLLGLGSQKMGAELPEKGYEKRLPEYLRLGEWALDQILPMVGRIVAKWGQAADDAKSALQIGSEAVGYITGLLGLGGQELKAAEVDETYAERLPLHLAAAEWALDQIMPMVGRIVAKWGEAAEDAKSALEVGGEAVGHITGILGLVGVDMNVKTTAGDFKAGLNQLLVNAELAMAAFMPFLSRLRATWVTTLDGVETDTLALNGEIAQKLGPIMDILNLAKTFDDLQNKKADPAVRRIAFEVVVARFVTQMKEASTQLKAALPEIEEIWDGALDNAVSLVEKIATFFGHIATAMKSGEEIALSKGLDPQKVLDSLGVFTEMVTGIQTMGGWQGLLGGIGGGGIGYTFGAPTTVGVTVPEAALANPTLGAGESAGMWTGLTQAIRAAFEDSEASTLDVHLSDAGGRRGETTLKLGKRKRESVALAVGL